jgi:acyl carrier protein
MKGAAATISWGPLRGWLIPPYSEGMDDKERIRSFIEEDVVLASEEVHLQDETPLLDGVLDSMSLMRLVAFLEEEFEVEIDDAAITADNFRTVEDIARLVRASAPQG